MIQLQLMSNNFYIMIQLQPMNTNFTPGMTFLLQKMKKKKSRRQISVASDSCTVICVSPTKTSGNQPLKIRKQNTIKPRNEVIEEYLSSIKCTWHIMALDKQVSSTLTATARTIERNTTGNGPVPQCFARRHLPRELQK